MQAADAKQLQHISNVCCKTTKQRPILQEHPQQARVSELFNIYS